LVDRPGAEHRQDQPVKDRHPLVERAQLAAFALQVFGGDGGERIGLGGGGGERGGLARGGRIAALGKFVQRVGSAFAGAGERQRRPAAERQLGRPAAVPVANRPGPGAGRLQHKPEAGAAVADLAPLRSGLEVLDRLRGQFPGHAVTPWAEG